MNKIYISGIDSINAELKQIFGAQVTFTNISNDTVNLIIESTNYPIELKLSRIKEISEKFTQPVPILTSSLCVTVSEQCSLCKSPERLLGFGAYNTISNAKLLELAPSKITGADILNKAEEIFRESNIKYDIVPDRVGLVFPRILAMIINEAAQVYDEKIAVREDIDTAMKLGTNYPFGPLEWADKIGIDLIYNILVSLQRDFGDDRYRPHPSLKEMVNLKRKFY